MRAIPRFSFLPWALPGFGGHRPSAALVLRGNCIELVWSQTGQAPGHVRVVMEGSGDNAMAKAITQALDAAGTRISRLAVSVPPSDVLVRYFSMPVLPKAELESAIPFEARKYVPFKMDSLVWDCFYVLPGAAGKNAPVSSNVEIVFAGLPRESFIRYRSVLAAAGVEAAVFEPFSQSLARLVAHKENGPDSFDCILEVARDRAQLVIAGAGVPFLTRDVQWSVLQADVSPEMQQIEAQRLVSEISVSMDFFKREHPAAAFRAVVCFGEDELVARCLRALNDRLPCQVASGREWLGQAALETETELAFAPAVGLLKAATSRASIPLNFLRRAADSESVAPVAVARPAGPALPTSLPELLRLVRQPQVGKTALLLGGSLSLLLWLAGAAEVSKAQRQLDLIRQANKVTANGLEHVDQASLKSLQDRAKEQIKFLRAVIEQRPLISEKLDAIVRALPDGVWLTGLTLESRIDLTGKNRNGPNASAQMSLMGACFLGEGDRELSAIQDLESRLRGNGRLLAGLGTIQLGKIEVANVSIPTGDKQQTQDTSYRIFQLNSQSSGRL